MSVEQPLWRALAVYRPVTLLYAIGLFAFSHEMFARPAVAIAYFAVLAAWTAATWRCVTGAAACTRRFLAVDLTLALSGILLTPVAAEHARIVAGAPTLPSIWTAGSVLAFALKGGWRWAAGAAVLVGAADIVQRGALSRATLHNVLLVWVAAIAIGYVVEVARASERTLARALEIEAATRERERLARDIHDGVLQVLAMVQRRSRALGGEAAELGRLAGEQEAALRALVTSGLVRVAGAAGGPAAAVAHGGGRTGTGRAGGRGAARGGGTAGAAATGGQETGADESGAADAGPVDGPVDVRSLLAPYAGSRVTFSEPGAPVPLPAPAAGELAAAVGAALDNVRRHAGERARAWILVEDEPDAVVVTVRDDGPGIPEGRLAEAVGEGRLGVALSIRGRLRDIGGRAELVSVPGQGTEVELTVPRRAAPRGKAG
ncbi:histidine kinase [Streptomyces sulfonofaciens]|uniref:Histidine kinase n=2 Tax=Streptomyces sulfonofaciens TaxID=68272 RepID=A0A919FXG2_9ACTN|nr:histidine kinase [Streptomyces sulfonofaciens]